MRKVTQTIANAFAAGTRATGNNTVCTGSIVTLHGNVIASRNADGSVNLTLAGWGTTTTRDRVNGIARALWADKAPRFWQQDHDQHVTDWTGRGGPIDSSDVLTFDRETGRMICWTDSRGSVLWRYLTAT
jgi:hypothetical protein